MPKVMALLFEKKRDVKVGNALLLKENEIGEINSLVSCHVCIILIRSPAKLFMIMTHYKLNEVNNHVAAVRSLLYNSIGINYELSAKAIVLLFRLSTVELMRQKTSSGTVFCVEKYEAATKDLKRELSAIFHDITITEIPCLCKGKEKCWIRLKVRKGLWESSFGNGFIGSAAKGNLNILAACKNPENRIGGEISR